MSECSLGYGGDQWLATQDLDVDLAVADGRPQEADVEGGHRRVRHGKREVLGFAVGDSEDGPFRTVFLRSCRPVTWPAPSW